MAGIGELVVVGPIVDKDVRTGVKDGKSWSMHYVYISGRRNTYRVLLNDDLVGNVNVGDDVAISVFPEVYQNTVSYRAIDLHRGAAVAARAAE